MWNNLNLIKPINDICEYGKKDAATIDQLPELVTILTSAAEVLTENRPIWEEIKIFKNIQTKYKRILHCDKCLQYLQRVGTCLRKMVLLNMSTIYLDLADKIITEVHNKSDTTFFLPSRQQLEYVLIRTQSAAKLICESLHYSREAFCYLISRLRVGHLIINLMMATSVTARLNIVFKSLLVHTYNSYKKLYAWRKKLKKGGWEWSKPLDLPEDLESWINMEDSEYVKPRQLPQEEIDFLTTIFDKNSSDARNSDLVCLNSSEPVDEECMVLENGNDDNGVLIERSELEVAEPELEVLETDLEITELDLEITDSVNAVENAESSHMSSSDEGAALLEKTQKLSKGQKLLLKKIKSAINIKELKIIWENLDFSAPDLLPQAVTPLKIRFIDKMFLRVKRKITELRKSTISEEEKKSEMDFIVKISRLKLAKTLGILPTKKKAKKSEVKLKPVKTFKELKELYNTIYHRLQIAQDYKRCAKLKKVFKRQKADIKLLVESGDKKEAKKLTFNTSKMLISDYFNQ